jgi:hypothetical protein
LFGLEGNVAFQVSENKGLTAMYSKTKDLRSDLNLKAASGACLACSFLCSFLSLSSWNRECANFAKIYSPMDIGVLWLLVVTGGLTREFWVVFEENTFCRE